MIPFCKSFDFLSVGCFCAFISLNSFKISIDPIHCFAINMQLCPYRKYYTRLRILIFINLSLCILTILPPLASLYILFFLLSSLPSQPMTADQPTWHSHLAFPSGNKREVSFEHFIKHSYTAWFYSLDLNMWWCVSH